MRLSFCSIILCISFFLCNNGFAQQKKDSSYIGSAEGIVWDSVHNYVLQAATLAVYKIEDSSLISYQLTNNFGEFHFTELPTGIPLRLVASYMGYIAVSRKFTIDKGNTSKIDLKKINLQRSENRLEEVIVDAIPPVRMNGDTLEFNAGAFNMDINATTEDWMRRLPGLVIWGDGAITVNGREVSSVLVNGKPFFGGDTKVATQNLPKSAVEKIQVYQRSKEQFNPLDSITEVNIKLKKNKSFGHFGKLAAGHGTDKRYEADANINYFNKRTQVGIVGAANNINKVADGASTLMSNSTYQGSGASIEYQPDFNMEGINRPNSGGITFQHNFINNPRYDKSNRLQGDYFINNNNHKMDRRTQTLTTLGKDSVQLRQDDNKTKNSNTGQKFSAGYGKQNDNNTYNLGLNANTNHSNNQSRQNSSVIDVDNILQSTNDILNESETNNRSLSFTAGLQHQRSHFIRKSSPGNLHLQYSFNAGDNNSRRENKTQFTSLTDPEQNKTVNRLYNNNSSNASHNLSMGLGSFSAWVLPRRWRKIQINLKNDLSVQTHHQNNKVQDWDVNTEKYNNNPYLTGRLDYTSINEKPALALSRDIHKVLANRYMKLLSFYFDAQWQLYHQKNASDHDFQNITQSHQKFVPAAGILFNNNQFGAFNDTYKLDFVTESQIPSINQLAPLIDSSNLYAIRSGNLQLQPAYDRQIRFYFNHLKTTSDNAFNYNINLSAGSTDNSFADSSIVDTLGRTTYYTVNADGRRYLNGNANVNKSFKWSNHQIQLQLNSFVSLSRNPSFVNGAKYQSNEFSSNHSLTVNYTFRDNFAVNASQGFSQYRSKQVSTEDGYFYKNTNQYTKFSASYILTRRLTLRSNITYNHSLSSGAAPINFTIWNANVNYRLLKGSNLELKLSALDLLHQNTNIINFGSNNTLTHDTVNVLQHYFMFTVSYFPRKFGKREKNPRN